MLRKIIKILLRVCGIRLFCGSRLICSRKNNIYFWSCYGATVLLGYSSWIFSGAFFKYIYSTFKPSLKILKRIVKGRVLLFTDAVEEHLRNLNQRECSTTHDYSRSGAFRDLRSRVCMNAGKTVTHRDLQDSPRVYKGVIGRSRRQYGQCSIFLKFRCYTLWRDWPTRFAI